MDEVEGNRLNFWRVGASGTTVVPCQDLVLPHREAALLATDKEMT